ncbi:hypothetical protein F4820DRAFT_317592 [Hypoxylon rubiginosum]|uniref:Uncharacterized protein n=1 Tax=Hypoxylon rubiginosum TaxID=110542 RepID=A0ACB9ZFR1_9PEZI|nr:hypothetical protein F4820DRAFT_317592 [Hypoxylon rubiginosum]
MDAPSNSKMDLIPTKCSIEEADQEFNFLVDAVTGRVTRNTSFGSAISSVFLELGVLVHGTSMEPALSSISNQLLILDSLLMKRKVMRGTLPPMISLPTHRTTIRKPMLDSLPEELHLTILDNLRNDGDWKTILHLRLVSKRWFHMVTPYVAIPVGLDDKQAYEVEELEDDEDSEDEEYLIDFEGEEYYDYSPIKRAFQMVAESNSRPDWIKMLPTRVPWKLMSIQLCEQGSFWLWWGLRHAFPKVKHILPKFILECLPSDIDDSLLAIVLATCTGLEKIKFPDATEYFGGFSRMVIKYAAEQAWTSTDVEHGEARVLGELKHLEMSDPHGIEVADVLDMLSLPKMQDLRLCFVMDGTFEMFDEVLGAFRDQLPEDKPRTQQVIDLTLTSCEGLSDKGLNRILAACPKIRSLFIQSSMKESNKSTPVCFTGALEKHGQGLEFLWLDTQRETGLDEIPGESRRLLRALEAMRDLRMLALWRGDFETVKALVSALPGSLRELLIIGIYGELEKESLYSLVGHPDLPNLRRVAVVATSLEDREPSWRKLFQYCIRARQLPPLEWGNIA